MTLDRMKELMDEQMRTSKSILDLMTIEERLEVFGKSETTYTVGDND